MFGSYVFHHVEADAIVAASTACGQSRVGLTALVNVLLHYAIASGPPMKSYFYTSSHLLTGTQTFRCKTLALKPIIVPVANTSEYYFALGVGIDR